jgi:hypothetical protein
MPECIFCESVRTNVRDEMAQGVHETGGDVVIDENSIVANYFDADGFTYINFYYSQAATTIHKTDGTSEPGSDPESGAIYLQMTLVDGMWRVNDVDVEES